MKRNKLLYIVIIAFLTFICCEKQTLGPKAQIIGTWEWVKSIHLQTQTVITPATEGYYETRIIFLSNDTVEIYRNDIIQDKYKYYFKHSTEIMIDVPESYKRMMLIINDQPSFYSIDNDSLIIDYAYVDGLKDYYKREY